jgi:kynureninase
MTASRTPTKSTPDALIHWRSEFPTVETSLHFISHSLGAMPRAAEEALRRYTHTWKTRSIRAWDEEWFALPTQTGNLLGSIFGAEPGSVTMFENATMAEAVALSGIRFDAPRNRLVCTAEDFPSMLYLYEGLQNRGAEIVRVAARENHRIDEQDILAAIDERTAVVAISHVLFRTSQVLNLAPIVAKAHAAGALVLIDAYQAIGTVPVDVQSMGIDLLAGGSVKWLCGGPGAGYLYVSPKIASRLEPAIAGWMTHARPFEFEPELARDTGARRYWVGTPGVPAFIAAREGYSIVAGIGVPAIREKSLRQTERLIAWADDFGMKLGSPREPERRGGTVVVDVPHADAVCHAMWAADVLLDYRPGVGLRLAPHFYTRDEEIDQVMTRVRDAVAAQTR